MMILALAAIKISTDVVCALIYTAGTLGAAYMEFVYKEEEEDKDDE